MTSCCSHSLCSSSPPLTRCSRRVLSLTMATVITIASSTVPFLGCRYDKQTIKIFLTEQTNAALESIDTGTYLTSQSLPVFSSIAITAEGSALAVAAATLTQLAVTATGSISYCSLRRRVCIHSYLSYRDHQRICLV